MARRIDRPIFGKGDAQKSMVTKEQGLLKEQMRTTGQKFGVRKTRLGDGTEVVSIANENGPVPLLKTTVTKPPPPGEEKPKRCPSGLLFNPTPPEGASAIGPFDKDKDYFSVLSGDATFKARAARLSWKSDKFDICVQWRGASPGRYFHHQTLLSTDTMLHVHGRECMDAPDPIVGAAYFRDDDGDYGGEGQGYLYCVCCDPTLPDKGFQLDFYQRAVVGVNQPVCTLVPVTPAEEPEEGEKDLKGWTLIGSITDYIDADPKVERPSGCVLFNDSATKCVFTTSDVAYSVHAPMNVQEWEVGVDSLIKKDTIVPDMPELPEMNFYVTHTGRTSTSRREIVGLPSTTWGTWDERCFGYYAADYRGDELVWARGIYVPDSNVNYATGTIDPDVTWPTRAYYTRIDNTTSIAEVEEDYSSTKDWFYRGNIFMQFSATSGLDTSYGLLVLRAVGINRRLTWNVVGGPDPDDESLEFSVFTETGDDLYNDLRALDLSLDSFFLIGVKEELSNKAPGDPKIWASTPKSWMYAHTYDEQTYYAGGDGPDELPGASEYILEPGPFTYDDMDGETKPIVVGAGTEDLEKTYPEGRVFGFLGNFDWQSRDLLPDDLGDQNWWYSALLHTSRAYVRYGWYLGWSAIDYSNGFAGSYAQHVTSTAYPYKFSYEVEGIPETENVLHYPRWVHSVTNFLSGVPYPSPDED